ncbi:MAG: UDP-N-acetylglucosamine 2-epimerase (non-hydrolyzing) [Bacteroidia bacterium]|nr:UDP-N-acetylglucosamine 2-epimerase (non-hydrolyzing) [Bacteroidia bacterium]
MKIISVVGARPNFMKIAPFCKAIAAYNITCAQAEPIEHLLVHTGQHYDDRMNRAFFEALGIPDADINLGIGSGSHAEQVGETMIAFEKVLKEHKPDWVVVVGDVNATCACSVTAKKEHVKVAHIEAGLRSFDLEMPEEINRMVTDRLSDLLLTPCRISVQNLKAEGVPEDRMAFVGNIMIDTLEANRDKAAALSVDAIVKDNVLFPAESGLDVSRFALMTMHRPSNVDDKDVLEPLIHFLCDEVASKMPLIWPMHPRARKQLEAFGLWEKLVNHPQVVLLHPLGYHEMLRLNMGASVMLTDSGGLQEECCVLGTPCLTLRWNTERPVTLREHGGASVLVGNNVDRLREEFNGILNSERCPQRPELWDGHTAERILSELITHM